MAARDKTLANDSRLCAAERQKPALARHETTALETIEEALVVPPGTYDFFAEKQKKSVKKNTKKKPQGELEPKPLRQEKQFSCISSRKFSHFVSPVIIEVACKDLRDNF